MDKLLFNEDNGHWSRNNKPRIIRLYALFTVIIMMFSTVTFFANNSIAESYPNYLEYLDYSQTSDQILNEQNNPRNRSIGKNISSPGKITSTLSPMSPNVQTLDKFFLKPTMKECEESYVYNTSFGEYIFPKKGPYMMKLNSYSYNNGSVEKSEIISGSEFFLRSEINISLSDTQIIQNIDNAFIVRRAVIVDSITSGYLETNVSFFRDKAPKITAILHFLKETINDIGISWRITTSDNLTIDDDYYTSISKDTISLEKVNLLIEQENLSLFLKTDYPILSNKIGEINWSDATYDKAEIEIDATLNEVIITSVIVDFPINQYIIDPTIIGTSTQPFATSGTPHRTCFYSNGYYWVFWFNGENLVYEKSQDGFDWSGNAIICPSFFVDEEITDSNSFDVSFLENRVLITAKFYSSYSENYVLRKIEGVIRDDIEWINDYAGNYWRYLQQDVFDFDSTLIYDDIGGYVLSVFSIVYEDELWYKLIIKNKIFEYNIPWVDMTVSVPPIPQISKAIGDIRITTLPSSSGNSVDIIVTYTSTPNKMAWIEYFITSNTYGQLNFLSDQYLPKELSAISVDNNNIFTAGKKYVGPKKYYFVWNLLEENYEIEGPFGIDDRNHDVLDDPNGRCILTKDRYEGMYLFYWTQHEDGGDYFLHLRYRHSKWANWSSEEILYGPVNAVYTSSAEIIDDIAYVVWTEMKNSEYVIQFLSIPTLNKVMSAYPDPWAQPGLNINQPQDIHGSAAIAPGNGRLFIKQADFTASGRLIDLEIARSYSAPNYFIRNSNIIEDDFDSDEIDDEWILNPDGGEIYLDDSDGLENPPCLNLTHNSENFNTNTYVTRYFEEEKEHLIVEANLQFSTNAPSKWGSLLLFETINDIEYVKSYLSFLRSNKLGWYDQTISNYRYIIEYTADIWYRIKLDISLSTGNYDIYIDDEIKWQNATLIGNWPHKIDHLKFICWRENSDGGDASLLIDDVKVRHGEFSSYMWYQSPITDLGKGWQIDIPWIDSEHAYLNWWSGQKYLITWKDDKFENKRGDIFTLFRSGSPYEYFLMADDGKKYEFDDLGRLNKVLVDAEWGNPDFQTFISFDYNGPPLDPYDSNGKKMISRIIDTIGRQVQFSYNSYNQLLSIEYTGQTIEFQYDYWGRLWKVIDDVDRVTAYEYDQSFTDFPILTQICLPEGGKIKYVYCNPDIELGTQAISKIITQRIYNNILRDDYDDEWVNYDYYIVDGSIRFARLTYDGWEPNTEKGIVEYLMDSSTKSLTTIWRDNNANELKRIRNWYSENCRISKTDNYLARNESIIESTNIGYFDNNGNPIYTRDTIGHELYSSFSNSDYSNSFYRPGELKLEESGKVLFENFLELDLSDWNFEIGNIDNTEFVLDKIPIIAPSLQLFSETMMSKYSFSPDIVLLDFITLVPQNTINQYTSISLLDTINDVQLCALTLFCDGTLKFYIQGTPVFECEYYLDIPNRITLFWDYDTGSNDEGLLEIWINGERKHKETGRTDHNNDLTKISIYSDNSNAVFDEIKICKGREIIISNLAYQNKVDFIDTQNNLIDRKENEDGQVTLRINYTRNVFPFGSIIIRNQDDTINTEIQTQELWGGDWYYYISSSIYNSSIENAVHDYLLDDWTYVIGRLWDEDFGHGSFCENMIWEDEYSSPDELDMAISKYKYHHGNEEPSGFSNQIVYWDSELIAASNNDYLIQYVRLPSENYPDQIIMSAKVHSYTGGHYYGYRNVSWGEKIFTGVEFLHLGPLPEADQWHEIILDLSTCFGIRNDPVLFNLVQLNFTVIGGSAFWDYTKWLDGRYANWPFIKLNNIPEDVVSVRLVNSTGECLYNVEEIPSSRTAEFWSSKNGVNFHGLFPINAYFILVYSDGESERTDVKEIFAGDQFDYQITHFYKNGHLNDFNQSLLLGTFEMKDESTINFDQDAYIYMQYGEQNGLDWIADTRLTQVKTKHYDSTLGITEWITVDYEYIEPYYQLNKIIDSSGLEAEYQYSTNWAYVDMVRKTDPNGLLQDMICEYIWDSDLDILISESNPNGYWTDYYYDPIGRITNVTFPEVQGITAAVEYNYLDPNTIIIKDPNNHEIEKIYDGIGRIKSEIRLSQYQQEYSRVEYYHDWFGNPTYIQLVGIGYGCYFYVEKFYDSMGRMIKEKDRGDTPYHFSTIIYDDRNRTSIYTDEVGRQTIYKYDISGRLIETRQPCLDGDVVGNYSYYPDGKLFSTRLVWEGYPSRDQITKHIYDDLGRVVKTIYVGPGEDESDYETYYYDSAGRLIEKGTRDGYKAYFEYDGYGRLIKKTYGAPSVDLSLGYFEYSYDLNGNIMTANRSSIDVGYGSEVIRLSYDYDERDRMKYEQFEIHGDTYLMSYDYDDSGNIIGITYPNGYEVYYLRDWYDRVIYVNVSKGSGFYNFGQLTYDSFDRLTEIDYSNGVTTDFEYNITGNHLLKTRWTSFGSTTLQFLDYEYDYSEKITEISDPTYEEFFSYDSVGRLKYASGPWGEIDYYYDPLGNRIQMDVFNGQQTEIITYEYNYEERKNRLTDWLGGDPTFPLHYDSCGRVISDLSDGRQNYFYEIDGELRGKKNLKKFGAKCEYDALSRRIFSYDILSANGDDYRTHIFFGDRIAYDPDAKGAEETYIYADGLLLGKICDRNQVDKYYHLDHLGSVRLITDESGNVVHSCRYVPFGETWEPSGETSIINYLGQVEDEYSGLSCMGVRFYQSDLGRFIQEDPLLGSISSPQTLNKYVYCANDPINCMDSNGMAGKRTGYLAVLQLCDLDTCMKLSEYHSRGINTFVPAPEYSPFDWFFIGLGVGLPVVGDTVCDAYFIIKDIMANDNDALLVDFGLALIPFMSTGHLKAGNKVFNAMESSADATKGARQVGGSARKLANSNIDDSMTVRHYTSVENAKKIEMSGHLNKNVYVTLPGKIPKGASPRKIESMLELRPGRGECYIDISVKRSDLKIPFQNGGYRPYTSGDIIQFQLRNNMPIHGSTFTPTYMP